MVGWMDENKVKEMGGSVRPVDASLLSSAVRDHEANPDFSELSGIAEFRDVGYLGGQPMSECSSIYWKKEIESSKVPMLVFSSWLDAGTAEGSLLRFQNYSNPQYLVILASSHGGFAHASPYAVSKSMVPPIPNVQEQLAMWIAFADRFLKGEQNDVDAWPKVRYFNLGEEKMRVSDVWPPVGTERRTYYFAPEQVLGEALPTQAEGSDVYQVDFDVNTGESNRWMTQMGRPIFNLDHREAMDDRMLCYTTEPLAADLQITGTPEVHLWLSSSHADAAVLAYLEDVGPDGQSRYVSEGGLRLLHRKITPNSAIPNDVLPHSFAQSDAQPMVPGVATEVSFKLWPTSVRISAGHRLRIAIAGADQTSFARTPAEGDVDFTIVRTPKSASHVVLPVIEGR
jgi:putative CocE/NonD family hydrolase